MFVSISPGQMLFMRFGSAFCGSYNIIVPEKRKWIGNTNNFLNKQSIKGYKPQKGHHQPVVIHRLIGVPFGNVIISRHSSYPYKTESGAYRYLWERCPGPPHRAASSPRHKTHWQWEWSGWRFWRCVLFGWSPGPRPA